MQLATEIPVVSHRGHTSKYLIWRSRGFRILPDVKGVINLRGRIIPVVDLRAKLDMPEGGSAEDRFGS
jgi:hypothetical protein